MNLALKPPKPSLKLYRSLLMVGNGLSASAVFTDGLQPTRSKVLMGCCPHPERQMVRMCCRTDYLILSKIRKRMIPAHQSPNSSDVPDNVILSQLMSKLTERPYGEACSVWVLTPGGVSIPGSYATVVVFPIRIEWTWCSVTENIFEQDQVD